LSECGATAKRIGTNKITLTIVDSDILINVARDDAEAIKCCRQESGWTVMIDEAGVMNDELRATCLSFIIYHSRLHHFFFASGSNLIA